MTFFLLIIALLFALTFIQFVLNRFLNAYSLHFVILQPLLPKVQL